MYCNEHDCSAAGLAPAGEPVVSDLTRTIAFASQLYREKAAVVYAGYVGRDPLARLYLRPGRANPYPLYEQLRARGTLSRTRLGQWVTTSHRVCGAVLRDRRFGVTQVGELDASFLGLNPPDHTRLRRIATPAFSSKSVATYATRIEQVAGQLLDDAARQGEFDLVSAFAAPLPIAVITALLGVPDSDAATFTRYGVLLGGALDGIRSLRHAAQLQAADLELRQLFESLFALRREQPSDDVVSHIVAAEGDQIQPGEMLPMCFLLLIAGFETTVNLISNGVIALLGQPEQWKALCADPEGLAGRAVEETLRYDPPVHLTGRHAFEPVELEGQQIRPGQEVMTLLAAANRDPDVYDNPATFDLGRDNPAPHLAFSSGIHYCLGQPLATLEARIALRLIAERLPSLRRAGPVTRRNASVIRGPLTLPVAV
jgi:P450-derived glycosyltransferase activator